LSKKTSSIIIIAIKWGESTQFPGRTGNRGETTDRKRKLEFNIVESINIEILIADKKWLISGVYRPQTIDEKTFNEDFIKTCDQITTAYDSFMFIGDLNYNMLVSDKSSPLQNVCDIFDLTNLVKSPTCYTKNSNPSLNDVILTNMPNNSHIE
jgi:hypothetical protein